MKGLDRYTKVLTGHTKIKDHKDGFYSERAGEVVIFPNR
jgi:hypothetical protein